MRIYRYGLVCRCGSSFSYERPRWKSPRCTRCARRGHLRDPFKKNPPILEERPATPAEVTLLGLREALRGLSPREKHGREGARLRVAIYDHTRNEGLSA